MGATERQGPAAATGLGPNGQRHLGHELEGALPSLYRPT